MVHDVYQAAYDAANSELSEIVVQFEQLRHRKQLIETAVDALKPFCSLSSQAVDPVRPRGNAPAQPFPQTPEAAAVALHVEAAPDPAPAQFMYSADAGSDAIQSRINNALGSWGINSAALSPAV